MQIPRQSDGENENGQIGDDTNDRIRNNNSGSVQTRTAVIIAVPKGGDRVASKDLDEQDDRVVGDEKTQKGV